MTRQENDREDLLREATGLIDRVEIRIRGWTAPLVAGFRDHGAVSLFVGQDEVYQFDTHLAWRRGYWQGKLLKAERGRLIELTRQRTPTQTVLQRRELTSGEEQAHLLRLSGRIEQLRRSLREGRFETLGEASKSGNAVIPRLADWLDTFPTTVEIADTARLR
jgi:hypothetical protein